MSFVVDPNAICFDNESIWFVQTNSNKLVEIDRENNEINNVICLDDELILNGRSSWDKIIKFESKLYIFINGKSYVFEYDIKSQKIHKNVSLLNHYKLQENTILEIEGNVYILPNGGVPFIEINLANKKTFEYKTDQFMKMNVAWIYELNGKTLLTADRKKNCLYFIELDTKRVKTIMVGDSDSSYCGAIESNGFYILPNRNQNILTIINPNKENIYINDFPSEFVTNIIFPFRDIKKIKDKIVLFPYGSNMILELDIVKRKALRFMSNITFGNYEQGTILDAAFQDVGTHDDYLLMYNFKMKKWIYVNCNSGETETFEVFKIEKLKRASKDDFVNAKGNILMSESTKIGLENFLEFI